MTPSSQISIVLPVFNGERYLEESVRSCMAQTFENWEMIIVDDASTDSTPGLVRCLINEDPRIRYVRNVKNRKLPASLNRGFEQARGNYFTWTSDDNIYAPNALERMVEVLDHDPKASVVYTDFTIIDELGAEIGFHKAGTPDALVDSNTVGACFLYRRKVHELNSGYAEDLYLAEDYDFWLRASVHSKLVPINENLYKHRSHGGALTITESSRVGVVAATALARTLPNMSWLDRVSRTRGYLRLVRTALVARKPVTGLKYLATSFRQAPVTTLNLVAAEIGRVATKRK